MTSTELLQTRIAPTPSGLLHRGNAFNFLLTDELAKLVEGQIRLRIDDLDQARVRPAYLQNIFDTLKGLGIEWQHGPQNLAAVASHAQPNRLRLYQRTLEKLAQTGQLFACKCSRSQIADASVDGQYPGTCLHLGVPLETPGATWRLHTPEDLSVLVEDIDKSIRKVGLYDSIRHPVLRKADQMPSYHIASLTDDVHFGSNLIVRGMDLLPSTALQLHLSNLLGMNTFLQTDFHHHPLLLDADGQKLSKSAGSEALAGSKAKNLRQNGEDLRAVVLAYIQSLKLKGDILTVRG